MRRRRRRKRRDTFASLIFAVLLLRLATRSQSEKAQEEEERQRRRRRGGGGGRWGGGWTTSTERLIPNRRRRRKRRRRGCVQRFSSPTSGQQLLACLATAAISTSQLCPPCARTKPRYSVRPAATTKCRCAQRTVASVPLNLTQLRRGYCRLPNSENQNQRNKSLRMPLLHAHSQHAPLRLSP